jgi:membrane associated rhomboid family serine protease
MNGDPATLVAVFRSRFGRRAREHALVLEAVGIPCVLGQHDGDHLVAVPPELAERAARELAQYAHENRGWRRPEEMPIALSAGWPAAIVWCLTLALIDAAARGSAFGLNWLEAGDNQGDLVRSGQVWRTVTALTLHADIVHLLGNLVFGALFVALVCELLGNSLALLAVIVAGAVGNLASSWLHGQGFAAIGASTAVFAALGIVGAHRWQRRKLVRARGAASWIPLVASAFLLAYLGGGSEHGERSIDISGHVCGFLAGALLGTLLGRFLPRKPSSRPAQVAFGLLAFALVAGAWFVALRR